MAEMPSYLLKQLFEPTPWSPWGHVTSLTSTRRPVPERLYTRNSSGPRTHAHAHSVIAEWYPQAPAQAHHSFLCICTLTSVRMRLCRHSAPPAHTHGPSLGRWPRFDSLANRNKNKPKAHKAHKTTLETHWKAKAERLACRLGRRAGAQRAGPEHEERSEDGLLPRTLCSACLVFSSSSNSRNRGRAEGG